MNRPSVTFDKRALYLASLLVLSMGLAEPSHSQVIVGYNSVIQASVIRTDERLLNLRSRSSFGVAGINVEPIDGTSVYDRSTIWRIRDTSKPSSLTVMIEDPVFEVQQDITQTDTAQVSRRESVYSTITGPLGNLLQPAVVSPFAPVIPVVPSTLSTSVFP